MLSLLDPSKPPARWLLWTFLLAPPSLSATTVYNNFSTNFAYDLTEGNPVGNAFDGSDYAEADSFIVGRTWVFSSLEIALSCFASCPDDFTVALTTDSLGQPGSVLESFTVPGASLGVLGIPTAPLTLVSSHNSVLNFGTEYWIVVQSDMNDSIAWNLNVAGDNSSQAVSSDGGITWFAPSGQTAGAYQVDAPGADCSLVPVFPGAQAQPAGVPEPGTLGMVFGCGLLLSLFRKVLAGA